MVKKLLWKKYEKVLLFGLKIACDKSIDLIISEDSPDSLDSLDSIDSMESTDSIDIIDSIDSILVTHKETANIHTTHKGARANKSTDGAARFARRPIGTFVLPLCVV